VRDVIEYERAILKAVLLEPAVLDRVASQDLFADPRNRELFRKMVDLREGGIPLTVLTIADSFGSADGWPAFLSKLLDEAVSAANVDFYLGELRGEQLRRTLKTVSNEITKTLELGKDAVEILAEAERRLLAVREAQVIDHEVDSRAAVHAVVEEAERRAREAVEGPSGVATGFPSLDRLLGGFQPGAMYLIAARTSVGKSALALSMIDAQIAKGIPVALASLEMSGTQVFERLMAARSGVNISRLRFGHLNSEDFMALMSTGNELAESPIRVLDDPGLTVRGLRAWARSAAAKGVRVLYLDYLGLLVLEDDGGRRPRWDAMAAVSREVKSIARELRIPIVALVQLNRAAAEQGEPSLHQLRDTGALEQDADVVMVIVRKDGEDDTEVFPGKIIILKNRSGPTGQVAVSFFKSTAKFVEETP
jgi:replicative DNA helicase